MLTGELSPLGFWEDFVDGLMDLGGVFRGGWQRRRTKYPDELHARAVRLWREADLKTVIRRLADHLGVHPEALRN